MSVKLQFTLRNGKFLNQVAKNRTKDGLMSQNSIQIVYRINFPSRQVSFCMYFYMRVVGKQQ